MCTHALSLYLCRQCTSQADVAAQLHAFGAGLILDKQTLALASSSSSLSSFSFGAFNNGNIEPSSSNSSSWSPPPRGVPEALNATRQLVRVRLLFTREKGREVKRCLLCMLVQMMKGRTSI
jgi:hypothetical protein